MTDTEYGPIIPRREYTTRIVGFVGKKGAGKTTAYQGLSCYRVLPLADPLKKMIGALGVPYECIYGGEKEKPLDMLCGKSARHAMQTLGTEWGRQFIGETLWLELWWQAAKAAMSDRSLKYIVVDDVRFCNEAEFLLEKGASLVKIVRPGQPIDDAHASETDQDFIIPHVTIVNDGTVQDLSLTVRRFVEELPR